MPDQLLNTLRSSKNVFWEENGHLPQEEIQKLWDLRITGLVKELGANILPSTTPSAEKVKRPATPNKGSSCDLRPPKRPSLGPLSQQTGSSRQNSTKMYPATAPISQQFQCQLSAPSHSVPRQRSLSQVEHTARDPPSTSTPGSCTRPIDIPAPRRLPGRPGHPQLPRNTASRSLPMQRTGAAASWSHGPFTNNIQDVSPDEYVEYLDSLNPPSVDGQFSCMTESPSAPVGRNNLYAHHSCQFSLSTTSGSARTRTDSSPLANLSEGFSTPASTAAASEAMSRTTTNDFLIGPLQMCRVNSQAIEDESRGETTSVHDHSHAEVGTICPGLVNSAGASRNSFGCGSPSPFPSLTPSNGDYTAPPVGRLETIPQEWHLPTSQSEAAPQYHAQQNPQVNRALAPRTQVAEPTTEAPKLVEVTASDGTQQNKAEITRARRPSRSSAKVFCPFCKRRKEGYHGVHELRRHIDNLHKDVRKVFVCKDISPDQTFLSNCKHCREKKTYSADYNAAAHLRRMHFNPCETPKGGRGQMSQHRGGIGGGDQPPMEELRRWMVSKWVIASEPEQAQSSHLSGSSLAASSTPEPPVEMSDEPFPCIETQAVDISGDQPLSIEQSSAFDLLFPFQEAVGDIFSQNFQDSSLGFD